MNAAQRSRAITLVEALAEAVRTAREIPSGHLYASVCMQMTLSAYHAAIDLLKGANLVQEQNYLLRWIGPEIADVESGPYRLCEGYGIDWLTYPEEALEAIAGEQQA